MSQRIKCEICGKLLGVKGFGFHLKTLHPEVSQEQYYKNYINTDSGVCEVCSKPLKFKTIIKGYGKTCSMRCSQLHPNTINKRNQTNIIKYGVYNVFKNKDIKDKIKQTIINKYSVDHISKIESVRDKKIKTSLERYGVIYPFQNEDVKNRIKQTNLERYGSQSSLSNSIVRKKCKEKLVEKYGCDNIMKNRSLVKQRQDKFVNSVVEDTLKKLNLILVDPYHHENKIEFECSVCWNHFKATWFQVQQRYACGRCNICEPKVISTSKAEDEIKNFIAMNLNSSEIIKNDREIINPYEIDLYIKDLNLAIEYCGLFWHNEQNQPDPNYHLKKLKKCEEKQIKLITIFEDEWLFKQDIVKSRLLQLIGKTPRKIYARQCTIKEIDSKTKNKFLDENHIQGHDNCSIKLGAFYEDKLISVMTFSKPNIAKGQKKREEGIWELSRFCSELNTSVIGVASKILKHFMNNYHWTTIYTYADRRWSDGNLYVKLGFKFIHHTNPNYFYVNNSKREHRYNHRKRPDEPKNISERILRNQAGLFRIWDCGHIKYVLSK